MKKRLSRAPVGFAACLIAFGVAAPTNARADIIYTTLGPNGEFDSLLGYYSATNGSSVNNGHAASFTSSQAFTIDSIDMALLGFSDTETGVFEIRADNGFGTPDAVLFSQVVDVDQDATAALVNIDFSAFGDTLQADTTYWLSLFASPPSSGFPSIGWALNNQGHEGHAFYIQSTGNWFTSITTAAAPAFQINGTIEGDSSPVPEPTSLLLLGMGSLGIYVTRRHRKFSDPVV